MSDVISVVMIAYQCIRCRISILFIFFVDPFCILVFALVTQAFGTCMSDIKKVVVHCHGSFSTLHLESTTGECMALQDPHLQCQTPS